MHLFRSLPIIAFFFWLQSCSNEEAPMFAKRMALTESVYASITLQPDSLYGVHAAVAGLVEHIWLEEGDLVVPGKAILAIKNTQPELNLNNARLALEKVQSQVSGPNSLLSELERELANARLKKENDSLQFVKQRNLWKKNIGTQNSFDAKKLAYETSENQWSLLKKRLERTGSDLDKQLKEANNNYRLASSNRNDYTLKSRIHGKVYQLLKEPGETVNLQEPVAMIGSASAFVIEMLVDEVDIARIDLGQKVVITLDAYPGEVFEARLSRISPVKDQATQTFLAEARFVSPPKRLYAGLSGEANIVLAERDNVLVIPRQYLINENQVRTDEGLVTVETGLVNLDKIEILSGIDENTSIYLPEK